MDTLALKGIAIVVLFVIALFGGLLPLCCIEPGQLSSTTATGEKSPTRRVISLLNSAAAGVFLSIALVHLLPDAKLIFDASLNVSCTDSGSQYATTSSNFDWAGFTAVCGFIMIVMVEQLMMWCLERSDSSTELPETDHSILVRSGDITANLADDSGEKSFAYGSIRTRSPSNTSETQSDIALETHSQCSGSSTIIKGLHDHQPLSSFRAMILLVSLSLHGIFEGLALGLQYGFGETVELLIAISVHKAIESFTVLLQFAQIQDKTCLKWSSLFIFSLSSPLGIAIGMPLADGSINADTLLVNAILQSLATGTFMFVTFVELLPVELGGKEDRFLKCLCLIAGFGLMCGLTRI